MVDQHQPTQPGTPDEDAVRRLLAQLYDAWAAGDATAYAGLFTIDADYTAFDGTLMTGREAIIAGHEPLFHGIMKDSRLVEKHSAIRFIAPECAVITSRGGIVMSWQRRRTQPSRKRLSALTMIAVHRDGQWSLTAFQNTRYRPWARTPLGRIMTALQTRQTRPEAR